MNADTSREDYELKLLGLCLIQLLGATIAFSLHLLSGSFLHAMASSMYVTMTLLLILVVIVSLIFFLCRPFTHNLWRSILRAFLRCPIPAPVAKQATREVARRVLRTFAILDLVTATVCVINTGGSERSIYSPFLFIVVPMIVIVDVVDWREILIYAVFAFGCYVLSQFSEIYLLIFPWAAEYTQLGHIKHGVALSTTTIVCSSFPIFFTIMEQRYKRSKENTIDAPKVETSG
jgi:hypothetical protein